MTTTYYKDKVIKLQQELDKRDEEIKRLNNELLLCEESKKNPDVGLYSKKNVKLMKENNKQAFLTSQNKDYVFLYNKKALSKGHRNGRYTALNTQNSNRIEARFFRGTLKESTFFMNLEFIHSSL